MILVGHANQSTGDTIREQRLIQTNQKITILWDTGLFCNDPTVNCEMLKRSIYSKQYETCTTAHLESTFHKNGYSVKAIKVLKAELNAVRVDTPYVLVLRNTSAKFSGLVSGRNPFLNWGLLSSLQVESELYDSKSGHLLWQGSSYWSSNANQNGTPSLLLVRALASDGFLNRKAEDVVDYLGMQSKDAPEGCPKEPESETITPLVAETPHDDSIDKMVEEYKINIIAKVRRTIVMPPDVKDNIQTEYDVTLNHRGFVLSVNLNKPSGNEDYDSSVKRAIFKAQPFPLPTDITLFNRPQLLRLTFTSK